MAFEAGAAWVDYQPDPGLPLMGNYRDDYAARGTHDPLGSSALVFRDSAGRKAAVVSVDVCELDRANVQFMRDEIASRCDLDPSAVLVAATHTHSGPAPMMLGALPKADDAAIERFLRNAARAAVSANAGLQPAALMVGTGCESRLSFNRRLRAKDGATHMNWEGLPPESIAGPLGPVDPQLLALAIETGDRLAAVALNFGLHPAILAGDNWLYSADFPGCWAQAMRQVHGDHVVGAFWNGCCGNVNHLDYSDPLQGRGYKMVERVGHMLAVSTEQALRGAAPVEGDCVAVSTERVPLEHIRIGDKERRWCEEVMARLASGHAPGQVDGLPDEYWAITRLRMWEQQDDPYEVEVMAIRVGDLAIVGLPGEIFCEYGMEIKAASPARHTMVIELANDAIGYVPTREAFSQGGYEPTPGAAFYTPETGDKLVASALRQLAMLFDGAAVRK